MPLLVLHFELHQPFRLHPDGTALFWEEKNRGVFLQQAERCYLPTLELFTELVKSRPDFKVSFGISGTFLEQAEQYGPQVIEALKALLSAGRYTRQVELSEQTYYHSLVHLFADREKTEFKEQAALHRHKTRDVFGIKPSAFANTELFYNNEIANTVADMGYSVILCDPMGPAVNMVDQQPISRNSVFRARGREGRPRKLAVLVRDAELSRQVMFLGQDGASVAARAYVEQIRQVGGEVVLIACDFPRAEKGTAAYPAAVEFWKALPEELGRQADVVPANPSEVAEWFQITECPVIDCPDTGQLASAGLGESVAQRVLLRNVEHLEAEAKRAGGELLRRFRYLTSSDHWRYLQPDSRAVGGASDLAGAYDSVVTAAYALTHATDELVGAIKSFNIRKQGQTTAVIIVTPETARLPSEGMGQFAQYVSGKSGGLGEVVSALCKGLAERKISVHLITLNLSRRFRQEAGLSEAEWVQKQHRLNPENIHLVSSSIFEDHQSAYDGSPVANAAEFQRQIVNSLIKEICGMHEGRAIVHTHDWMAGGIVAAYAKLRGIPILHTVHNTHTGHIPLEMFYGVNIQKLWETLVLSDRDRQRCVDSHATAIKNATKISCVGERFLKEVVEDYFMDRPIIPWTVRQEIKAKHRHQCALVIPNGVSPDVFPENQPEGAEPDQPGLAKRYGPDDDLVEAKRLNLLKFQQKMGLTIDPDAILLYWPSRLDPVQKGVELLEGIAQRFVEYYPDVQIAVVADPVGGDRVHTDALGRIAWTSRGRIAYHRFDQDLSTLGYAAAGDVFGASLYEPFGQIDVVGNLYGATATNRDTGGYSDKITMLSLRAWGSPMDSGNGVLFKFYDREGLWWGLSKAVEHHRYFRSHPKEWEKQMRRIMTQARNNWSLDSMVARYITAYEQLNDGRPLV